MSHANKMLCWRRKVSKWNNLKKGGNYDTKNFHAEFHRGRHVPSMSCERVDSTLEGKLLLGIGLGLNLSMPSKVKVESRLLEADHQTKNLKNLNCCVDGSR